MVFGTNQPDENTYVIDVESGAETARLIDQDHLVTENMGGLFPEGMDLSGIHRVLDIACGPGGWVQEVAFAYPEMDVVGIDINRTMIQYAQGMAQVQRLDNASFQVMNVLGPLAFPDDSFDFVNARFMVGFMLPETWPSFIQECQRVTRSGGIIRLTESDDMGITNSPAYEEMTVLGMQAMQIAGRSFSQQVRSVGITAMLGRFLLNGGYKNIQRAAHTIDYSTGQKAHAAVCQNINIAAQLGQNFVVKTGIITDEKFEALLQQAQIEMLADNFCGLWYYLSVWGEKP